MARFLGKRNVEKMVVSSVVPAKNSAILKAARKVNVLWLDWKLKLGVEIDYPNPQSIGADRLANAAAVTALYGRHERQRRPRFAGWLFQPSNFVK